VERNALLAVTEEIQQPQSAKARAIMEGLMTAMGAGAPEPSSNS
jgi:hypothetical protein